MEKFGYLKPEVKKVLMLNPIMEGDTISMSVDDEPYDGEFGANENGNWESGEESLPLQHSVWDSEK